MAFLTLDRFSDTQTKHTAQVTTLIFDIEGVIIDSVGAQFRSFYDAVMKLDKKIKITNVEGEPEMMTAREIFLRRMHLMKGAEPEKFASFEDFTIEHYHEFISGRSREGGLRNLLDLPREEDATAEENELIAALGTEKDRIFQEMLKRGDIKAFPAVVDMLYRLHDQGIRLIFASGSSNAAVMLYKAKILHLFEVGVLKGRDKATGQKDKYVYLNNPENVKLPEEASEIPAQYFEVCNPQFHGKPEPWIFVQAAVHMEEKLGLKIQLRESAVFEDSPQIVNESFEVLFGAVVGVDTGKAFDPALVRAGNIISFVEGDTADSVAEKFRDYMLSRLTPKEAIVDAATDDRRSPFEPGGFAFMTAPRAIGQRPATASFTHRV